jgi:ATP-dependent helicase/DNAse subunit B
VDTCAGENRFPALFELEFGGDTAVDLGEVRLKGRVDRVDLCFGGSGEMEKVRVLDYKGSSRSRTKREDYIREIRSNLDCQLPVYAFAAQQFFFGEYNTAEVNAMTEAGYLFYQREMKAIGSDLKKSLLPMNEEGLLDEFLATLNDNIRRLKNGDFAVDPLLEAYTDYQSACRTEAVTLDALE